MPPRRVILLAVLVLGFPAAAWAYPNPEGGIAPADSSAAPPDSSLWRRETEWHLIAPGTSALPLAHGLVVPGSLRAWVGGTLWLEPEDFRVAAREGVWLPRRLLGPSGGDPVRVRLAYRFLPAPLPVVRELHAPAVAPPPAGAVSTPVGQAPGPAAVGAPPGSVAPLDPLTVRGSKSVRLASGNRRELVVDQTLRLAIEGRLTPEITVRAALSDDNLPVVPEGNTEQLRDVDKVLVELESAHWRATLGDFVARREGSVFGDYRRKLQGVSLTATPGAARAELLAGAPRGIYRTLQIRGEEANQGPYRLGGGEAGRELFIVAGSERVALDGQSLTRGADRDYIIDYMRGTITFTFRRLITVETTIVVEFEEGEGPYARTVTGGGASGDFTLPWGDGVPGGVGVRLTREGDDPQRLRSGELSDADRAALAAAGDDPTRAVADGIVETEPGQGHYRREALPGAQIWVYDPSGAYEIGFFYAGAGVGNYGLDSLTVAGVRAYGWRGEGGGSYRVGRPLPLPESRSVTTLTARLGRVEQPLLAVEWNVGRLDHNAFSSLDDADNAGVAWSARAAPGEREVRLAGRELGRIALEASHENRDSCFRPFVLHRDLFTYDRWGLAGRARRAGFLEERDVESRVTGTWVAGGEARRARVTGEWGRLSHGGALDADRRSLDADWLWEGWNGASLWEQASAADRRDPLAVERRRQRQGLAWTGRLARPGLIYEAEQWRDAAVTGPAAGGARLRRWGGTLEASPGRALRWLAGFERGLSDSLRADAWQRERDARTWRAQVAAPPVAGVRVSGEGTLRRLLGSAGGEQITRLARLNLTGLWPRLGSDWSLEYGVDNSRIELLDRQIVFVGLRLGDYDRDGNFLGRGQGDYNVVYAGTDSLVATTEVKGNLAWRQEWRLPDGGRGWGRVTALTTLAARGRSRADAVGPLLRFASAALFDPESTVLGEVGWQQELDLLQGWQGWDLRLKHDFAQALDRQFAAHPEDRLRRLAQGTVTRSLFERTTLQWRTGREAERRATRSGAVAGERSYAATTWRHEGEWSLRPGAGSRLALAGEFIRRDDAVSGWQQREWAVRPSARWRLEQRWSGTVEARWAQVTSAAPVGAIRPYFFAYPGLNRDVSARLAWDPSATLSIAAVYFGRQLGGRGWQHDVRLESTARF
jgi:hypothetical protein